MHVKVLDLRRNPWVWQILASRPGPATPAKAARETMLVPSCRNISANSGSARCGNSFSREPNPPLSYRSSGKPPSMGTTNKRNFEPGAYSALSQFRRQGHGTMQARICRSMKSRCRCAGARDASRRRALRRCTAPMQSRVQLAERVL